MSGSPEGGGDATAGSPPDANADIDIDIGVSTPAAVGLYLAVVAIGIVSFVSVAAAASAEVFLTTLPTALMAGLFGGIVLARVRPSLLFRLGRWRWRTVALWLPAPLLAGGAVALEAVGLVPETGLAPLFVVPAAGVALTGRLVALAAHDLAVGATVDDGAPVVGWTWHQSGPHPPVIVLGVGSFILAGVAYAFAGANRLSIRLGAVGAICLVVGARPTIRLPSSDGSGPTLYSSSGFDYARGEIRAYEDGLVVEPRVRPSYRRVVHRERLTGVRLTEDRLVLERRWWPAIRCDRSAIDDIDAVVEAIDATRLATGDEPMAVDEPQF